MKEQKIIAAVVTVSDSRELQDDVSGASLVGLLESIDAEIVERVIVTDDLEGLRKCLYALTENPDINLIITTGGTGFGPRDNTPEATRAVIEREAPGL
ncbi:MAG TPA: molybdopterin-binding protein, partial [Pyrinomonadaceae bacterium]|nr:molybdopterin-binding protein [Pyrinomonadaceae bacterium]